LNAPTVIEPHRNPEYAAFASLGRTLLVHPVTVAGKIIGVYVAGDKRGPDPAASNTDMKLLGAAATHTAIFLENAALYDDLNSMFIGTLYALTASIDAKDRYTCGHSRRVAHLTRQLAEAIGLDEYTVERMHIAGLVHDVGKIGVPESVLLKPGRLTESEFEWIRQHPDIGYRILKDIPQLRDILPGVLHHHESWNGKGYPTGLKGEEIPLVARLICLADAFDAMSSTRTYRSAMGRKEVLAEIARCAGVQFDPALASLFVTLNFDVYDQMVIDHRAADTAPTLVRETAA
jgi:HD-GYP domain-containing protein (c-di-GMP phosphodiesterase class II)